MNIHELDTKSKKELIKVCEANYDKYWRNEILKSTKAISFDKFKAQIKLEPHLQMNISKKHKIALSRFRLSNHQLMIEKGGILISIETIGTVFSARILLKMKNTSHWHAHFILKKE